MTTTLKLKLSLSDIGAAGSESLLLHVDGSLCALGGGAWQALKLALPVEDRDEVIADLEAEVRGMRPLPEGEARWIELPAGVSFRGVVVAAALLHEREGRNPSTPEMMAVIERAVSRSVGVAAGAGAHSLGELLRSQANLVQRAAPASRASGVSRDPTVRPPVMARLGRPVTFDKAAPHRPRRRG